MIFTMIGGGAHRLLSTVRGAIAEGVFRDGGELRYYDLDASRSRVMAEMIQKSPEFRANPAPITVKWDLTLETALEGADVVSVTLLAGGTYTQALCAQLAWGYGFIGSDNVSYPGAFLALRGAPILLNIAHTMERVCPNAILLDFANPVSVHAALVSRHTSIRCYGVCEGYLNHCYDLTRLLTGRDEFNPDYEVKVAGVNHASFIVEGTLYGEKITDLLDRRLAEVPDPISCIECSEYRTKWQTDWMRYGLNAVLKLYKERGVILFSTEPDGFEQYFREEALAFNDAAYGYGGRALSDEMMARLKANSETGSAKRMKVNAEFAELAKRDADEIPWNDPAYHTFCVPTHGDVQGKILTGLSGAKATRVAVSAPNDGAVANMPKGMVLEYSFDVTPDGLVSVPNLMVPASVYGMTSSIAMHQTLLADACYSRDPYDLKKALLAYPYGSDTKAARELWKKLLMASRDDIDPAFLALKDCL